MADLQSSSSHDRSIAALFDTRDAADKAAAILEEEGIAKDRIMISGGGAAAAPVAEEKGFWESLKNAFMPEEDCYSYAEALRRGDYLLSVRPEERDYERALDILEAAGAVDIEHREAAWRNEGWTGYAGASNTGSEGSSLSRSTTPNTEKMSDPSNSVDTSAVGLGSAGMMTSGDMSERTAALSTAPSAIDATHTETAVDSRAATISGERGESIPVYEERLRVGKRDVSHGRVRVRSYVVETPITEQVTLRQERVEVERRPVDRAVNLADAAFEERVIEAEERAEEAVIAKEARVKEEITLRRTQQDSQQTISDTVRHTEVEIEDDRGSPQVGASLQAASLSTILPHMDVLGSDGIKIGTVDHLEGDQSIKLAKDTAPDGQHHFVPLAWVDHVDTHVHLAKASDEAKAVW